MVIKTIGTLEDFLTIIKNLKVWRRGKEIKPHKYVLLLSLIRLLERNDKHLNRFTFDEIEPIFESIWEEYSFGSKDSAFLEYPFYHLSSDGFWHFKIKDGADTLFETYKNSRGRKLRFTKSRITETIEFAYLDDNFYRLFQDPDSRRRIKREIEKVLSKGYPENEQKVSEQTSLFQHEALAIEEIATAVQKYTLGKCVSNLLLYDKGTGDYYECDVIVVSYCGIYLVELKHWTGHIKIAPYNWVKDGSKYRPDPHASNTFKAKILKGIYQHQFRTYPYNLYVESVVVLTNPEVEVIGASNPETDKHCPTFESIDSFIDYLRYQNKTKKRLLEFKDIEKIISYLESLRQVKRPTRYALPGYEIREHLTQKPDFIEVVARPKSGNLKNLFRFRIFYPPTKASEIERERFIKRAENTLAAVSQIGDHPNILKVWPVPDEIGAIIEGSEWSEQGTLRDWILDGNVPSDEKVALEICGGILEALQIAHQKGIIHRAVRPENILMAGNNPKLMNFDLSYQLASQQNITVIPDVSALEKNAYTAPEVYEKKDVDESTDLFAVGVILFELLTGGRPFSVSTDLYKTQGRLTNELLSKLTDRAISENVIYTIDHLVRLERTDRIQSAEKVLSLLGFDKDQEKESDEKRIPNRKLRPGERYDVYEIVELIGKGAEAQVYKARTPKNEFVAIKLFNQDIPSERIFNEEQAGASVQSSYLVYSRKYGYWKNDRYFIVMDYVPGRLMREDIKNGIRPNKKAFVEVARCLLEAVKAMHQREIEGKITPLIHGDIKPDNIILRDDGSAVLFDFGCAGPPRIDSYQGTEGYVAPDLVSGADLQFCESGDLFGLGVSLFEWIYGERPYITTSLDETPRVPKNVAVDFPESIVNWLLKAVQARASNRFNDIDEMYIAFRESLKRTEKAQKPKRKESFPKDAYVLAPEPKVIVPPTYGNRFVAYLNSLHNTSSHNENALAESQALSEYFGYIHVPLAITQFILKELQRENGSHIILTGHAGDGKSTIALELIKRCRNLAFNEPLPNKMSSHEKIVIGNQEVHIIKDLSELEESQRVDVLRKVTEKDSPRYFIISNSGTLLNTFEELTNNKVEWLDLQSQILTALEAGMPQDLNYGNSHFKLLNLARTDNISTALEIFERMLNPELWESCEEADCKKFCPVFKNVQILQEHKEIVKDRIELVYRRLFEYGTRLTLRQITAHLAYSITAGLDYEQINYLISSAKGPTLENFLFFNRFFGDTGSELDPLAEQLQAIREVRALEPGLRVQHSLERKLWLTDDWVKLPSVKKTLMPFYEKLRTAGKRVTHDNETSSARLQVRRLIFFFGEFNKPEEEEGFIATFLHSPMILRFTRWQRDGASIPTIERQRLKQSILHVIQEHFTGTRLPENAGNQEFIYITLNRHNYEIRQSAQIVLGKFPADNFKFIVEPIKTGIGNTRYEPILKEIESGRELRLEIPFLDYVTGRFRGEVAQQLQSFYADRLERFKVELLNSKKRDTGPNMMLIRLQLNHRFISQTVSVSKDLLEVF